MAAARLPTQAIKPTLAGSAATAEKKNGCVGAFTNTATVAASKSVYFGRSVQISSKKAAPVVKANSTSVIRASADIERPWKTADARLALEDGSVWRGTSFGARGTQAAEVVFNTSLTGYQEIITDPSYAGQIVLMTVPHIGNTGINEVDEESRTCFTSGLVVRSISNCVSNYRSSQTLPDYLRSHNMMGIADIDTRAITKRLRDSGSLNGVISTDRKKTDEQLVEMARGFSIVGQDLITGVTCEQPYVWSDGTGEWEFSEEAKSKAGGKELHVVAYDFGIKHNILRRLASYGCRITVVPSTFPPADVLAMHPDGVLFSNGPGDPSAVPYAVESVKAVVGRVPSLGICMGHQLMGQALGGSTFKLKFGHHGGNHPVRHLPTGRVEISAQNHNYAVDPSTLPEGVEVTHINLNDGTCAGLAYPALNAISIQYHPESSPGPHDADPVFNNFVEMMIKNRAVVNA